MSPVQLDANQLPRSLTSFLLPRRCLRVDDMKYTGDLRLHGIEFADQFVTLYEGKKTMYGIRNSYSYIWIHHVVKCHSTMIYGLVIESHQPYTAR